MSSQPDARPPQPPLGEGEIGGLQVRAARMRLALRGLGEAWSIFVQSRIGVLGLAIIVLFALMAIAHPILMNTVWDDRTYDAVTGFAFEETEQPAPPSWKHPLGTDPLGRRTPEGGGIHLRERAQSQRRWQIRRRERHRPADAQRRSGSRAGDPGAWRRL